MSTIHLAIPVFFLLVGIELLVARLVERDVYRLADSVTDLSCGILQQVVEVFLKTALFAGYAWLFTAHRLFDVPMGAAWAWAACFVLGQFLLVNLAAVAFLYASPRLLPLPLTLGAVGIALSLVSLGGLLDRRAWAPGLEAARIVAAGLALAVF